MRAPIALNVPIALAVLVALQGCGVAFPAYRLTPGPVATAGRFADLPTGAKLTARAIVRLRGIEVGWTLRVAYLRPDHLRIAALDDLGGTKVLVVRNGTSTHVLTRAPELLEPMLADGLCADLAVWLLSAESARDRLARAANGQPLVVRHEGTHHALFWSSDGASPIDRMLSGERGTVHAELRAEWRDSEPTALHITNHRFGYELDLEVREWQPVALTAADFAVPPSNSGARPR